MSYKSLSNKTLIYLKKVVNRLPRNIVLEICTLYFMLKSKDVGLYYKGIIAGSLVYFVNPLDLFPDGIPGVGLADDISVILAAINILKGHKKFDFYKDEARNLLEESGWVYKQEI